MAILWVIPVTAGPASAICAGGSFLNPVTDVCWECVFPLSIAGIEVMPGPYENNLPDLSKAPICTCPAPPPLFWRIGIPVSFWEPARVIETVKDPYCFPTIGLDLGMSAGLQRGTNIVKSDHTDTEFTFTQAHQLIAPWWSVMELLTDFACVEHSGFDVAVLTELQPEWQSDLLSFIIQPEALLFANPIARIACAADAVSTNAGYSLSPEFWCIGSGGAAYPMTGHAGDQNVLQANNTAAARMLYKTARELALCDTAIGLCSCVPTPVWIKHNYRSHIAKPVPDVWCHPFGRSSLIWGWAKNPPVIGDNFSWQIFRRRSCCAF